MNNLQIRFIDFSDSIMSFTECCKENTSLNNIIIQLNRSSSSIGANYSEAQSASSKKDFHNKIRIALKEARETEYWLTLIKRRVNEAQNYSILKTETEEIIKILTTIVRKTDPNQKKYT